MDNLQQVSKRAYQRARERYLEGGVPLMLGVKGLLALAWQDIRRYNEDPDTDTLVDIVSNTIFALALAADEEEFDDLVEGVGDDAGEYDETIPPGEEFCPHANIAAADGWLRCMDCDEPIKELQEGEEVTNPAEAIDDEEDEESEAVEEGSDTEESTEA